MAFIRGTNTEGHRLTLVVLSQIWGSPIPVLGDEAGMSLCAIDGDAVVARTIEIKMRGKQRSTGVAATKRFSSGLAWYGS